MTHYLMGMAPGCPPTNVVNRCSRAAIVEFSKGGLAGTSTEDIARRADISQPYLFRLFGTKKELFLAAVERTFDRALTILVEAAGDRTGMEAKMAMTDAYRMFLDDRTLLLTQMHAYAACDDDDVRRVTQTSFGKAVADGGRDHRPRRRRPDRLLRPRDAAQHGCGHGSHGRHRPALGQSLPGPGTLG